MELVAFSLKNYRRFAEKTSVKLHGPMIAFVGPNEAGKSSLLRALSHLNSDAEFEHRERPRRSDGRPSLSWHLLLSDADKGALAGIPDTEHIERVVVTKTFGVERRRWHFEPRNPSRPRATRVAAVNALEALRAKEWINDAHSDPAQEFSIDSLEGVLEILASDPNDFTQEQIGALNELKRRLEAIDLEAFAEDEDVDADDRAAVLEVLDRDRTHAASLLEQVAEEESGRSPSQLAVIALRDRLPTFELFEEEDRVLLAEYDLEDVADNPPRALQHLAGLAGLNLAALRDEARAGSVSDVATRRLAANRRLTEEFENTWNQMGVAVNIEVQGTILHIQATTPTDGGLESISERSDGMRWFAALLAFSSGWKRDPILLVDEIETHLHYDAQADLIAVLQQQRFTSKVIYTTHSLGCLPPDLGTGVRVVEPVGQAESRIGSGLWRNGAGFSPLLVSMGAAAMSFMPARRALLAEGQADAILLPTILRDAAGKDRLQFHVAPGLAVVALHAVGRLDSEAARVAYLVDGDEGGQANAAKLLAGGVSETRIFRLLDDVGLETEDLVRPELYVEAANEELRCWNTVTDPLTVEDVAGVLRTKALAAWCSERGYGEPDKVAVAQRVVDMATDGVVDDERGTFVRRLLAQIEETLDLAD